MGISTVTARFIAISSLQDQTDQLANLKLKFRHSSPNSFPPLTWVYGTVFPFIRRQLHEVKKQDLKEIKGRKND